jgi:hypothetical protein
MECGKIIKIIFKKGEIMKKVMSLFIATLSLFACSVYAQKQNLLFNSQFDFSCICQSPQRKLPQH